MLKKQILNLCVIFVVLLALSSCAALQAKKADSAVSVPANTVTSFISEFGDDISLPTELAIIREKTFIQYDQSGKPLGIMALKGRIDVDSLLIFLDETMVNTGGWKKEWQQRPGIKCIVIYAKDTRKCLVYIEDANKMTFVEIWVGNSIVK